MEGFIGEIRFFAGNFAPRNWAFCQGQLLSISQNTALFSILGTIYGGDGRTTFGLPDMRGRSAVSDGTGPGLTPRREGQKLGSETNTISILNMPAHNHIAQLGGTIKPNVSTDGAANADDPANAYYNTKEDDAYASSPAAGEFAGDLANNLGLTLANTGNQQPINNMQPFLTVNYVICLTGTFPSRN